jgi:hypothetical protein
MRFAEQAKGGTSHISAAQEEPKVDSTTGKAEKENLSFDEVAAEI